MMRIQEQKPTAKQPGQEKKDGGGLGVLARPTILGENMGQIVPCL